MAFEVATIRQNKSDAPGDFGATADGYRLRNMPLSVAILTAFGPAPGGASPFLPIDRLKGAPEWVTGDRYDIEARVSDTDRAAWQDPTQRKTMLPAMLLTLLMDRCQMVFHHDQTEIPVYALLVGKGGPKFKESAAGAPIPEGLSLGGGAVVVPSDGGRMLNLYNASVASLALILSKYPGRPVVDRTGLTGRFDFSFTKTPGIEHPDAPDAGPSIFSEVQEQFGLRLEPAKSSVETVVIDHIERPRAN